LCDPHVNAPDYIAEFIDTDLFKGSRWNSPALPELIQILHRIPVCMVYGKHDAVTPSHQGTALARKNPGLSRIEIVRGSGHAPYTHENKNGTP